MKITIARSAGFCFGVRRAIDIALKIAKERPDVFMLGDIVHNETVVETVKNSGIKKIARLGSGKDKTLLVRAHGAPSCIYYKASKKGYLVIDATCPMVKEIHKIAKTAEKDGYKIIIIGDANHDEVRGIIGQLSRKPVVISGPRDINNKNIKGIKRAAIVVQSTQNVDKVERMVNALTGSVEEVRFFNTICHPTRQKQDEAKKLALKNNVMIVIGSKNSANTRRLYEVSKRKNRKTHWVESIPEIKRSWFRRTQTVGVLAGASTPDEIINNAVAFLRSI
jgi:4-hydroxy-3-methylbut-2-enyl diphosphate reductase